MRSGTTEPRRTTGLDRVNKVADMLRTAAPPTDEGAVVPPAPFYGTSASSSGSSSGKQKNKPATARMSTRRSTAAAVNTPPKDARTVVPSQSSSSRKTRSQRSPSASPAGAKRPASGHSNDAESSLSPPASLSSPSESGSDNDDDAGGAGDSSGKRDQTSSSIDEPPSPAAHFGLPAGSPAASAATTAQDRKKPANRIPEVVVTTSNRPSRAPSPSGRSRPPTPSRRAAAPKMRATLSASAADPPAATRGPSGAPMVRARSGVPAGSRTVSAGGLGARRGRAAELAAEEAELGGYRSSDSRTGRKRSRSPLVYTPRSRRMKTDAERQVVEAKRQKLLSELEVEEGQMADATHPLLVELETLLDRAKEKRLELVRRKHELAEAYLGRLNEERVERTMCQYLDQQQKMQTGALLEVQLKMRRLDAELSLTDPLFSLYCPNNINLTLPPDPAPFLPVPNPMTLGPRDAMPAHAVVAALERRKLANHDIWRLRESEVEADVAFLKSGGLVPLSHHPPPPPLPLLGPGPALAFEEPRREAWGDADTGTSSMSGKEGRQEDTTPTSQERTASSDESGFEGQLQSLKPGPGHDATYVPEATYPKRARKAAAVPREPARTAMATTTEEMDLLTPPEPSPSGWAKASDRMDVDEGRALGQ